MGFITTNAPGSLAGALSPAVVNLTIPLSSGTGSSPVVQVGRYNDLGIYVVTDGNWNQATGQLQFMACDTPDGTFLPVRYGGSTLASDIMALQVVDSEMTSGGCFFQLGAEGFGGASLSPNNLRDFTLPYLRLDATDATTSIDSTDITLVLKMY